MSFFAVPLSGLNASQSSLQAISSNLANTNTDGYKDQNVTFSDLFAQSGATNGALDPVQVGQGVRTASTTSNFTDGPTSATNISSNMALSGDGFFVVQQTNGAVAYSRAGDFTANKSGQLVAPDGSLVLGYPAQNGVVQTASALQPLNVGTGLTSPASATTEFNADINLDANTAVGATASPSSIINTFDSLGEQQVLTINYTRTASGWSYEVTVPTSTLTPPSTPPSPPAGPNTTVASGNLTFDSSGNLTSPVIAGGKPGSISIAVPPLADGSAPLNINWNLGDSSGRSTVTQTSLATATANTVSDGRQAGTLHDYSVEKDGTIEGSFSNGATIALGQVAVATVENTQGLQQIGNNLFQVTAGSGQAQVGLAGTGGRATIVGGSVEGSNVDVASEFSKMIVAQQSYQANAKVVSTLNQVSQATLAMIQG